jgi:ribosomal protein S4
VPTIFAARQFVNHGHVTVNGKRVNIRPTAASRAMWSRSRKVQADGLRLEATQLAERDVPEYIEADHNKMAATFVRVPALSDVPYAGRDGTEPGRRVLLALIPFRVASDQGRPSGRLFCMRRHEGPSSGDR